MLIQSQSPSLRPLTTAHLAQTMSLLELSWEELRQKIESELAQNPALEIVESNRCPNCHRRLNKFNRCPQCTQPTGNIINEPIVYVSSRNDFNHYEQNQILDDQPEDDWTASSLSLASHVLRQISVELEPADRELAVYMLTCINDDGLLDTPLIEIAQYHHVLPSRLEKIRKMIQFSKPIGVGSTSPKEALLIQLEVLGENQIVPALAKSIIQDDLDQLSRRAYVEISKKYHVREDEIVEITRFIGENLNPYPGRENWGGISIVSNNPAYFQPDIIISKLTQEEDSPLVVEILSPYAGCLRINHLFKQAIELAPSQKVEDWQSSLESATLLVKCLHQRNQVLVLLMQLLVVLQREYLLHGDAHMKPITRAQLASQIGVHESTISRAVSGKSVQLPNNKIIPLSLLFDRSLHIRAAMKEIIGKELQPLCDTELAELLDEMGYSVARRTVAKYRAIEGIPPARFRNCGNNNSNGKPVNL